MAKLTTELTNKFCIPRESLISNNSQEVLQAAKERLAHFKTFTNHMETCFQSRFIMFKQEVWYDFKTGLLIPKFDKAGCVLVNFKDFSDYIAGRDYNSFRFNLLNLDFRCITEDECRKIFAADVQYPYRKQGERKPEFRFGDKIKTVNYLYYDS